VERDSIAERVKDNRFRMGARPDQWNQFCQAYAPLLPLLANKLPKRIEEKTEGHQLEQVAE
jgi:hypothetical protein